MDLSLLVIVVLLGSLLLVAYWRGGWRLPAQGLEAGGRLVWDIWPQLILGFALAGMVQVLIPNELVARWLGEGSGLRGIFLGTVAGVLAPGGPYLNIPLVASLMRSGAGAAPLAAFLTAWGIIPLHRLLVWEVPMLSGQFVAARFIASLVLPVAAGLLTSAVMRIPLFAR